MTRCKSYFTSPMRCLFLLLLCFWCINGVAQTPSPVQQLFPEGTTTYPNIQYANDTLRKHLLDIYLPPHATANTPLVVWVHGGAWMLNDKYADMSYMKSTVKGFLDSGY